MELELCRARSVNHASPGCLLSVELPVHWLGPSTPFRQGSWWHQPRTNTTDSAPARSEEYARVLGALRGRPPPLGLGVRPFVAGYVRTQAHGQLVQFELKLEQRARFLSLHVLRRIQSPSMILRQSPPGCALYSDSAFIVHCSPSEFTRIHRGCRQPYRRYLYARRAGPTRVAISRPYNMPACQIRSGGGLTVHRDFADWYSRVRMDPPLEVLNARWSGIEGVRRSLKPHDILNLVRAACAQKSHAGEDWTSLREEFKKADPSYLMNKEAEFSVLAAIALVVQLDEAAEDELSSLIAYCLSSATFNGWKCVLDALPARATAHLHDQAIAVRRRRTAEGKAVWLESSRQIDALAQAVGSGFATYGAMVTAVKSIVNDVNAIRMAVIQNNRAADEELNILWWLFGEWCPQVDSEFKAAAQLGFPLLAASQLASLTEFVPGPVAHRRFLLRALQTAGSATHLAVAALVSDTPQEWRKSVLRSFLLGGSDFQPILMRIDATVGRAAGEGGLSTGDATEPSPATLDLAEQLYGEILIGRIYRRLEK